MLNGDFTIQLYTTKRVKNKDSGEIENLRVYTLLTSFVNGESNPGGTYDENLSKKNNSQYSLTFSISKMVEGQINPIFNMIVENRRLRLTTSDDIIDFIITAITPQVSKNNVIYNVTCQDVFSYDWTRQNIKISYDSLEEHDTALYISQHAKYILEKSKFGWKDKDNNNCGLYMIDPSLEDNVIADFPNLLTTYMVQYTERTYSTLNLDNVTPYAAMIELADKYGATLDITYPYANKNKDNKLTIINFKNQQMKKFKGLYVRPEVNLSNFSISRKTDNFCSILRVSGGEDADGNIVSLMPEMPYEIENFIINNNDWEGKEIKQLKNIFYEYYKDDVNVQTNIDISNYFNILENVVKSGGDILYNFDYYYNAGLMQKNVLKELNDKFSIELRDANLLTSAYSRQYNRLYSELMLLETEVEDYISNIAAEEEYKEELLNGREPKNLSGTDLENYNNSCNAIKDIEFTTENSNTTSLNKMWKKDENDNYSIYVRNSELLYGKYALNNKIVELEQKKEELEKEYIEYIEQAKKLEQKYTKEDGTVDWTKENSFSVDYLNSDYVNYCYYISLAEKLYSAIGPNKEIEVAKRGYYQVFIDEIEKLIDYYYSENKNEHVNFEGDHRTIGIDNSDGSSALITNLLSAAEKKRDDLWKTIYNEYGDYISEASYSDTNQLSEDALYLVAQKEFASRCNPSIEYSSTVIDLHKILNVSNSKIDLGDIIYFYNKDLYNEYNGNLVIEVPNLRNAVQVEIENMADNSNEIYPITNTLFNNNILTIKVAIDEQEKANGIVFSPTKIKVDGKEVIVLNKYLDMRPKPIQLQITGITKKLREITTQLTVSTNKMIENLLGKILRKTN